MDVRESRPDETFGHVDHPLLHRRVRDPKSMREGELMAVVEEFLGVVAGGAEVHADRLHPWRRRPGVHGGPARPGAAVSSGAPAAGRICVFCDRPIKAGGHEFVPHSASGAQPSSWAHDIRAPSCKPLRADER
ncbi:hypothetical protein [Streptomyces sp. PvR034]|uniref:hypothetical protein n=1 Tax=Streptomyces sp. PvR034 TaxID=3156401 RepID=UPI00339AEF7F